MPRPGWATVLVEELPVRAAVSCLENGRWLDSVLMQRPLGAGDRTPR
jgi:hypothetical protein